MSRLLPLSLLLLFAASVSAQVVPPVAITIDVNDRVGPDRLALVHFTVENTSDQPLTHVRLEMSTGFGSDIQDVSADDAAATCSQVSPDFTGISCTFPLLAPHAKATATTTTQFAPGHYNLTLEVRASSTGLKDASRVVTFYREFSVTTPANEGPGSFRQAILDSNAQCPTGTPCRISFEIPDAPPAEGWFTIALASPLPAILGAEITIDGERQTAITGDTNPRGPEVFLDGRAVTIADGLLFNGVTATVRGLAIGGFPGNGILVLKSKPIIQNNDIGVDPTGTVPVPNGLRGIMGDGFNAEISGNVLSHNRRSGLFLWHGANIHDNRIESNGASGMFLGGLTVFDSDIVIDNVITGNHDFGIALADKGSFEIRANTIAHNGGGGIDVGLNGRTPRIETFAGTLATPRVTSARYDAASGDTIIEGVVTEAAFSAVERTVFLYANHAVDADGFAEGERFLGAVPLGAGFAFSLRVHDDLRGLYVDGSLFVKRWDLVDLRGSTEFGPPALVGD